jgi:hypothetical protein
MMSSIVADGLYEIDYTPINIGGYADNRDDQEDKNDRCSASQRSALRIAHRRHLRLRYAILAHILPFFSSGVNGMEI